ncbi:hypothetical protein RvY_18541 [Ramazzottius varieornatus]|uniref:Lipase maturation factor n=1 Tax=Ramazzottius varieornatus TaxID=947166 RepID=A0A1D1W658_RAMVA|nr:hypothetical protein RvY_18541 [Ramazzottius varieornatus]
MAYDIGSGQVHVHNLFLWGIAVIYLFAFASLYHQLPGLYGENGVLPASKEINPSEAPFDFSRFRYQFMDVKPTLLWLTQALKMDTGMGMDVLAMLGILLASSAIITRLARNMLVFGALWVLYLSLYTVGNVFLWFQWDALLMEAGFVAFIFAPIPLLMPSRMQAKLSRLSMWPVKWLFFRLMLMSGILKLQSGCQTWWKLTALHHHYESQCIPTFLAWYIHQLPPWFDALTLLHALLTEVVLPFFFFAPSKGLRKFAWYNQVILQVGIIITGNYNFFNLLTIVLSLSLLEDRDLGHISHYRTYSRFQSFLTSVFNWAVVAVLLVATGYFYNIQYDEKKVIKFKARFTETDVNRMMDIAWPISVGLGFLSLVSVLLSTFTHSDSTESAFSKLYRTPFAGFYGLMALSLFSLSLSPFSSLTQSSRLGNIGKTIRQYHAQVEKFNIVNGYGLFRRMTGVEGRPEIIFEGSDSALGPWKEYEFLYKPGSVDRAPPFIVPHQPRLDWQMWFAALSDQQRNPWVYSVVYRLLQGKPEVIRLAIDPASPFRAKPPKFIRGRLYKYWFTLKSSNKTSVASKNWWKRRFDSEWMAPVSLTDENLLSVVTQQGLTRESTKKKKTNFVVLRNILKKARESADSVSAPVFIWSLFMVNVVFHRTLKAIHL